MHLGGGTTTQLVNSYPGQFVGVELLNGSHVDSLLGNKPVIDVLSQVITQYSPGGNPQAVYTLSTGWIDDFFTPGAGPLNPVYGLYGLGTGGSYQGGGQYLAVGPATGIVLPA